MHLQTRVPPCSNTALGHSAARRFIPSGTLNSSQGSSASAAPAYGMVCSHSSMVVSGHGPAMYADNFYGQWSAPQMEPLYEPGSKRYINNTGHRNGVWPPACVTSRSRSGDPPPNPQGAGADGSYLSLSMCACATNSTLRRETCEDRHARLPCGNEAREVCSALSTDGLLRGRILPDRAHNYDQMLRLTLTVLARGCTAGVTAAPTRTRDR